MGKRNDYAVNHFMHEILFAQLQLRAHGEDARARGNVSLAQCLTQAAALRPTVTAVGALSNELHKLRGMLHVAEAVLGELPPTQFEELRQRVVRGEV